MKRFITVAAVAALALMSQPTLAADLDFDLNDASSLLFDGPVQLIVGDTLRVVVDENLSTGYQWVMEPIVETAIYPSQAVFGV